MEAMITKIDYDEMEQLREIMKQRVLQRLMMHNQCVIRKEEKKKHKEK